MKLTLFAVLAILGLPLFTPTANAHERNWDRVTRVDRYHDSDVIHYDHHHRRYYLDDDGRLRVRTYHHDHHYVAPRYRHHDDDHGHGFRWFFRR